MEWTLLLSVLIPILLLIILHYRIQKATRPRLPPGPKGWPIFGNMFDLGNMPHRTLAGLKQKYGPVLWIKIGSINTLVLQNSQTAAELFKNHDITFVERSITEAMKVHDFHKGSLSLASYGNYWRIMKRIMTVEMLVNKKINESISVRKKCVDDLISWIEKEAAESIYDNNSNGGKNSRGIKLSHFVFLASFNMLGNLMLSKDLVDPQSQEGSEFFSAMISLMEWAGHPNIVDVFPWLKWLDPQGLKRRAERDMSKIIKIVSKFVKERLEERRQQQESSSSSEIKKDYLEVLLKYNGNQNDGQIKIADRELNIIIMEIFIAGSETTSGTIEWAMVELLSNPEAMLKVKEEMKQVIEHGRSFEERDIDNLKYLQAVIKETLRLHPPIPFLVPRMATKDTNFMGYEIRKDTQLFVNVWAIGRDPQVWEDPNSFKPERFLGSNVDFKGQHYELIPFGAGRRICAGIPLAQRMLHLILGSLLHKFDWGVDESLAYKLKDDNERMGIVVRKMEPLIAIPFPK